jgi:Uma2 family endonuclease
MGMLQTQIPLNVWLSATWEEFVKIADDERFDKCKSYYYKGRMRFEPMSTGADHSKAHTVILLAIGLYTTLRGLAANGHDGCSYRKTGFDEFQPDVSYYIGDRADTIAWCTRVVELDIYPVPDLIVEISDTSLSDDKVEKRLQYEELEIPEYWIVDVQGLQMIAFAIAADGSSRRIRESQVLPGLDVEVLEQALQRSRQENQSIVMAWLMEQFR